MSSPTVRPPANPFRSPQRSEDVEKATYSETPPPSRRRRWKSKANNFCTAHGVWMAIVISILAFLAIFLGIFLPGRGGWAKHKAWEAEHAYDWPVHVTIKSNFPDPAIIYHEKAFYAFGTNSAVGILGWNASTTLGGFRADHIQLAVSEDHFRTWRFRGPEEQPLARVGAWADQGWTKAKVGVPALPTAQGWSPGVVRRKCDGRFVLYYSVATTPREGDVKPGHCVGAAVSRRKSPDGPYEPLTEPLVCDLDRGGAIDPSPFRDKGGDVYLAYKVNGNNVGHGGRCGNTVDPIVPTPLMLQKMSKDGVTAVGPPIQILDRTDADGPLVEAPNIVRSKAGIYFLFYSSGCTRDSSYDIKYATADDVTGPYIRNPRPLLSTGDWSLEAPGSPSVIRNPDASEYLMAFHSRMQTAEGGVRAMWWSKLALDGRHARLVNDVELGRIDMRGM